ncbi:histone-lysine N-methyltransferase NSD2 isoform X2 [Patella vulgata]|uniref:histone-lysine N-methyltransferase NSD2 isoform X2 n=1 Tax=Patella vulgata TaxID=6465 RepID=UPI0024A827B3|nr:histone-lysine N-methyltransferase NSD2 isoform X2 [Patella vulgata]
MENNSSGLTNGVSEMTPMTPSGGDNPTAVLPSSGVHHHLPQIPTMDKGLKKAYSKSNTKQSAGPDSVSVTHVEGTGAVLKISETTLEVDDLLNKMEAEDEKEKAEVNGKEKSEESKKTETEKMEKVEKFEKVEKMEKVEKVEKMEKVEKTEKIPEPKTSENNKSEFNTPKSRRTSKGRKIKDKKDESEYTTSAKSVRKIETAEQRTKRVVKRKLPKSDFPETEKSPKETKVKTPPVQVSPEMEQQKPAKYGMGDMLWAKVGGHPWWPCMVSECPYTNIYTRIQGGARIQRMYHVQYFGNEGERGWISESSSLSFTGLKDFLDYADERVKSATKSNKVKITQTFRVLPSRKMAWDIGVAQATEAYGYSNEERQEKFTFVYDLKSNKSKDNSATPKGSPTKKQGKKRKMEEDDLSNESVEDTPVENKTKRQKTEGSDNDSSSVKALFTRPKAVKYEPSFDTFYHKHEDSVLDEHPDWSAEEVKEHLSQQWSLMSEKQKARYKTKFTMETESPNTAKRSPRVSKPSIKKLEAEEDKKGPTPTSKPTRKSRRMSDIKSDEETEVPMETEPTDKTKEEGEEEQVEMKEVKPMVKPLKISKSRKSETLTTDKSVPIIEEKKKSRKTKVAPPTNHDSDSNSEKSEPRNDLKSRVVQSTIKSGDDEYELDIFKLHASSTTKRENICTICEQTGQLIECQGACQGHFHATCLALTENPDGEFRCGECLKNEHTCFRCKVASTDTRKCSVSSCGKFYHEECFKKYPQSRIEGKSYFCPLHTCATCAADNPKNPKATKGRLLRCVRCPVAYHAGDYCIAAGSINLAGNYIVCSSHFQPNKTHRHHSHVNVSWCFQCSKGGTLLCCESCPAAYHPDCLKMTFPEGSWYCSDCSSGKKPLYGDLIWIKIGSYRWWPGEVCHPRNVPLNIQEKPHQVGEFPVRFFGSHDFYWTHQGRVFLFQEGDKGSHDGGAAKGLTKIFQRGVVEATEAFKIWQAAKENKEQLEKENNAKKPAPYKFVMTNIPIGNVQINKADLSEIPRCECRSDQENPCSSDSDCLNRMLMYECHPLACPAAEKCQNQKFQKRDYPVSERRGWGLYTKVDVKKGQFVNEYVGDLVDEDECRRRIKQAHEDNITNFYMLTLDKNRVIDAGPKGNLSRFMNHCCQPNCETQKWMVNGDVRVGLFALNDIPSGSELTFNYNLECLGNEKTICACGSDNCSGFLGVRPKSAAAMTNAKKLNDKDNSKKKKEEHNDDCFGCHKDGDKKKREEHNDDCFGCDEDGDKKKREEHNDDCFGCDEDDGKKKWEEHNDDCFGCDEDDGKKKREEHNDDCFGCDEDGDLMMCDHSSYPITTIYGITITL